MRGGMTRRFLDGVQRIDVEWFPVSFFLFLLNLDTGTMYSQRKIQTDNTRRLSSMFFGSSSYFVIVGILAARLRIRIICFSGLP